MKEKKILVIEDDPNTQNLYTTVLTKAGFSVDSASDGAEGLIKCQTGGYDLIFIDVMLPKMDGIGILTELSKNPPKVANKNIYLLTNLTHDPILNEGIRLGAKEALLKTDLNPDQLVDKAKEILLQEEKPI